HGGVSRNTIRNALRELTAEGLIETATRRGTFVRQHRTLTYHAVSAERADRPSEGRDAFYDEVRAQGRTPSQDFSMVIEPADASVASRLRVAEGDLVVARSVMRYVDKRPWSDQVSYYAMDIAEQAGLAVPHNIPEGTVRAMARAGHEEVGVVDEISSRMPTPEEIRGLETGAGVPMLLYWRTTYSPARPLRVTRTLFPADRNVIRYELGELVADHDGLRVTVDQHQ
ncbi:MAG: GntR family transcriptional regulator, partial [Stackebrandtia sp.]